MLGEVERLKFAGKGRRRRKVHQVSGGAGDR